MKEYKKCQISRYQGRYLLYVYNDELKDGKWVGTEFKTIKAAKSHFKCFYAPLKTKELVKTSKGDYVEHYEAC